MYVLLSEYQVRLRTYGHLGLKDDKEIKSYCILE